MSDFHVPSGIPAGTEVLLIGGPKDGWVVAWPEDEGHHSRDYPGASTAKYTVVGRDPETGRFVAEYQGP